MRQSALASILLAVLAAVTLTAPINAQQYRSCPDGSVPYYVQEGDTVWAKEGPDWNVGWAKLVEQNLWLADRRVDENLDKVFVLLRVNEPICGLRDSGLSVGNSKDTARVSSGEVVQNNHAPAPGTWYRPTPEEGANDGFTVTIPNWVWLLLGIIIAAILARWWWKFTHPTTAGEALYEGGVHPDPENVLRVASQLGEARYVHSFNSPTDGHPARLIGPIERGVINGVGYVGYAGNTKALRQMRNESGFRAMFRLPDGTTEPLVFLQRCGNDVTFSGLRYFGFSFTPTRVLATPPDPQPTPTPSTSSSRTLVFGLAEAREYDELPGITDTECARHLVTLRHHGVTITFREEADQARRSDLDTAGTLDLETEGVLLEIRRLEDKVRENKRLATRHRSGADETARLMNRFGFIEIPDETEKTADGEPLFFDGSGAPID